MLQSDDMDQHDGKAPHKLEDLKSKLFSKNYRPRIDHRDGFSTISRKNIADTWETGKVRTADFANKFFARTSFFKKIFFVSLGFFALSLCYASYVFFAGSNTVSNNNIDITVTGNNFTAGGEDLDLVVGITNRNSAPLDLVDLVVEYPKGAAEEISSSETERLRQSLGTIPPGAVRNENVQLVLFGEQGSVRPIRISLEYRVAGSNAIFVKEKTYNVNINSTPINLSIKAPATVSPDQNITLDVTTSLNATRPAEDIVVKLDYPPGFHFEKSVPAPSYGDNVWYVGDLAPGAEHGISISGTMIDVFDGEEKTFNVSAGSQSSTNKSMIDVTYNSIRHTVAINKPFIETSIAVNGVAQREYAIDAKTPLNVEIRYANNLNARVDNLSIEAKISGNAWNRATVRPLQGHYDSSRNTITWDASTANKLREVNPGEYDSVSFSLDPVSLVSSSGSLIGDPSIQIDVNIFGRQASVDASVSELKNSASTVVHVISDLGFSTKALYYSGPFENTGPIPPHAEQTTTYTVVWTLSNTSNTISRAQLTSSLPSWVTFANRLSPASEDLTYNPSNRSIVWNIGKIAKGTGLGGAARSVAFQVSFKPSLSQTGSSPLLMNEAVLTGHDDFASVDVKASRGGLATQLENDPGFPANGGIVVQ